MVTADGPAPAGCTSGVKVTIQRKTRAGWKKVKNATTSSSGKYATKIKDRKGKYRAKIALTELDGGAHICRGDASPVRRHRHR